MFSLLFPLPELQCGSHANCHVIKAFLLTFTILLKSLLQSWSDMIYRAQLCWMSWLLGSPSDTFLLAGAAVSWKGVKQTSIMEVEYRGLQPTLRHLIRGLDLRTLDCWHHYKATDFPVIILLSLSLTTLEWGKAYWCKVSYAVKEKI